MRNLVIAFALALTAVVASPAGAGGWATVGFEPLPDNTPAGGTWKPTIFVKQHGVTPLAGLQPTIRIDETSSGASRTFIARPTEDAGVYEAEVVFPTRGDWRIAIDSGFGGSGVTYGPVSIAGAPVDGDRSFPGVPLGIAIAAVALAVAGAFGVRRLRRLTPASG